MNRPSIPLYVAGALVQIAGLAAVSFQVGEMSFAVFTIGLTLVGTATSYLLRWLGVRTGILKWGMVALALLFITVVRRTELFSFLIPSEGMLTQEVVLVCALALTATFGSFLLITDDTLVFTCVWSIAMIGLTGTLNVNQELPICFVLFLFAAAFLLVHQNALRFRESASVASSDAETVTQGDRWRLLRAQIVTAVAAWGGALLLGTLVAIPVQMIGRNMSLKTILQQLRAPAGIANHAGIQRLTFNNPHDFTVGLGPVDDDTSVHLSILSDKPHYWRGRTYDFYTGHGWGNSANGMPKKLLPSGARPDVNDLYTFSVPNPLRFDTIPTPGQEITTSVHLIGVMGSPFYCAAEPLTLRAPVSDVGEHEDRTIGSRDLAASDYEVKSLVSTAHPSDLRNSGSHYPPEITDRYLVTSQFDDSTEATAQEIIKNAANNPYDQASAIKRYIADSCVYNAAARAVPHDRDAVAYFLNESHEGYCDLYASAMVALCRCAGLPARVTTGYAPGVEVPDNGDYGPIAAKGDTRKRYLLRGTDLHAWAEVYFNKCGWIVFDATQNTAGITPQVRTAPPPPHAATPPLRRIGLLLVSLALAVTLLAVANELRLRLLARSGLRPPAFFTRGARTASHAYRAAVRLLSRRGVRRSPTMTAGEYVSAVHDRFGTDAARALRTLTTVEERLLYANPNDAAAIAAEIEVPSVKDALRDLRRALKNQPKRERTA